jgi:hypothetical protein
VATNLRKPKKGTVVFDAKRHRLKYNFEYNPKETEALRNLMSRNESVTLSDLRRVALWKLDRIIDVPDSVLRRLQKLVSTKPLRVNSSMRMASLSLVERHSRRRSLVGPFAFRKVQRWSHG